MKVDDELKPIFILSLPRSGSTLLQRIIATHKDVGTVSEPWLLLPLLSVFKKDMCRAKYGHSHLTDAVNDFCDVMTNGKKDYYSAVRKLMFDLYRKACTEDVKYFIDKTPRYSLMLPLLIECFPDAKFVILWRNPLATLASRITSYGNVWRPQNYEVDFYECLPTLIDSCESYKDKIYTIKYEDIKHQPSDVLPLLFEYLELDYSENIINEFTSVQLKGKMGDKSGINKYKRLNSDMNEKWVSVLASPIRRWWSLRYLKWLGKDRLLIMGYDFDEILENLKFNFKGVSSISSDVLRYGYSRIYLFITGGYQ